MRSITLSSPLAALSYQVSEPDVLPVSALEERGLDELREAVERQIVSATGRHVLDLTVELSSAQLRWELLVLWLFLSDAVQS